ncbi:MAG: hypothetical protein JW749_09425 [Sedimentisphaerales bacterium]|nr:hypothetical protein [Sedimentisphaerales bacterium]
MRKLTVLRAELLLSMVFACGAGADEISDLKKQPAQMLQASSSQNIADLFRRIKIRGEGNNITKVKITGEKSVNHRKKIRLGKTASADLPAAKTKALLENIL